MFDWILQKIFNWNQLQYFVRQSIILRFNEKKRGNGTFGLIYFIRLLNFANVTLLL